MTMAKQFQPRDKAKTLDVDAWKEAQTRFERDLRIYDLVEIAILVSDVPLSEYLPLHVYAAYQAEWLKHHKVRITSSEDDFALIKELCRKRGVEQAVRAIRAYFAPELHWVKNKTLNFLVNDVLYNRHIVPVLASRRGEQAEHPGTSRIPSARKFE